MNVPTSTNTFIPDARRTEPWHFRRPAFSANRKCPIKMWQNKIAREWSAILDRVHSSLRCPGCGVKVSSEFLCRSRSEEEMCNGSRDSCWSMDTTYIAQYIFTRGYIGRSLRVHTARLGEGPIRIGCRRSFGSRWMDKKKMTMKEKLLLLDEGEWKKIEESRSGHGIPGRLKSGQN